MQPHGRSCELPAPLEQHQASWYSPACNTAADEPTWAEKRPTVALSLLGGPWAWSYRGEFGLAFSPAMWTLQWKVTFVSKEFLTHLLTWMCSQCHSSLTGSQAGGLCKAVLWRFCLSNHPFIGLLKAVCLQGYYISVKLSSGSIMLYNLAGTSESAAA